MEEQQTEGELRAKIKQLEEQKEQLPIAKKEYQRQPRLLQQRVIRRAFNDINISASIFPILEQELKLILTKARQRARDNKRNTILARDI